MRTYAVGDIHGCYRQLDNLIALCMKDCPTAERRFVFVGDYIDRGPSSRGVLDFLIRFKAEQPDVICLAGNHEHLLLTAVDEPGAEVQWYLNGGLETLQSYNVASPADIPTQHIEFLKSLPTHFDDGLRYYVHAGVHPFRSLYEQDPYDLVWIREPFLSFPGDFGRLVVHGHTPLGDGRPDQRQNRLNVDTGATYGRALTAAVFDNSTVQPITFIQVR